MVGSALLQILRKNKKVKIITRDKKQLDLLNQSKVQNFFKNEKIDIFPIGFFTDNKKYVIVNKNDNEMEIKSKGWNHFS